MSHEEEESMNLMNNSSETEYYRPYFDVETADILSRITNAFIFCGRDSNFLTFVGDKPDAYGPFWISTSLVFTVAVASHISHWLSSWMQGILWQYDFQSVVTASSLIYGYAAAVPFVYWFALRQYQAPVQLPALVCLYGYSLLMFLPATILCVFPSQALSWLALLVACVSSTVFLLRSLTPIIVAVAATHSAVLMSIVGCTQLVLAFCLKILFFYQSN